MVITATVTDSAGTGGGLVVSDKVAISLEIHAIRR